MTKPNLSPPAAALIEKMRAANFPPLHEMTPPEARTAFAARHARMVAKPKVACTTQNITLGAGMTGVPTRIYRPRTTVGPLPAIVCFHGGGWTVGDLDIRGTSLGCQARHQATEGPAHLSAFGEHWGVSPQSFRSGIPDRSCKKHGTGPVSSQGRSHLTGFEH